MRRIIINSNHIVSLQAIKMKEMIEEAFKGELSIEIRDNLSNDILNILNGLNEDILIINLIGGDFNFNDYQRLSIKRIIEHNVNTKPEEPKALMINIFNNNVKWNDIEEYLPELVSSWHEFPNSAREKQMGNSKKEQPDTFPYMPRFNTRSNEDKITHAVDKVFNLREEFIHCYPGTEHDSYKN